MSSRVTATKLLPKNKTVFVKRTRQQHVGGISRAAILECQELWEARNPNIAEFVGVSLTPENVFIATVFCSKRSLQVRWNCWFDIVVRVFWRRAENLIICFTFTFPGHSKWQQGQIGSHVQDGAICWSGERTHIYSQVTNRLPWKPDVIELPGNDIWLKKNL